MMYTIRHCCAAALLMHASFQGAAQDLYKGAAEMERTGVASTTTYVMLLGDKDYDTRIKEALVNGWSITKQVEFVEPGEPLPDPGNPGHTFLSFRAVVSDVPSPSSRTGALLDRYLSFWQGLESVDRKMIESNELGNGKWTKMNIMQVPLDIAGREEAPGYVAWRIPLVIRAMEQVFELVRKEGTKAGASAIRAEEVVTGRAGALRHKTLLVWEGRFNKDELATLRENYPHAMEVVPMADILKALTERNEQYAVLVFVVGYNHNVLVHDAATYELLYAHFEKFGHELKSGDVKALAKEVARE